jgi:hypothetical protein
MIVLTCGCSKKDTYTNSQDVHVSSVLSSITTVTKCGKSLGWFQTKNMIAFCIMGNDSYYDVYAMISDVTNKRCLTGSGCPQRHNGNSVWHPSGEYIVFTAQNEDAVCNNLEVLAP